ncbi:hypothetical protein PoB_007189400 [Plakobranchus ocellatus]|uniref:Uncharacterized protein n=1 Tax=Plakobranchus ocellatus TaxID=259542 RepID=A0AAV4DN33_9GAST|nr:hypothetical protein PoB_007189400 [Plakobranchus ocellatus]
MSVTNVPHISRCILEYSNRNSSNSSINGNKIKICRRNISSNNTISSNISNSSGIDNSNTSTCGGNRINSIESQTAAASTAACTSSNYTSSNIRISSSMDNGNTSSGGSNKLTGSKVWNHKQQQHLQLCAPAALAAALIQALISASAAAWTMAIPALAVVPTVVLSRINGSSISKRINSSSVSTTKHQQSYHLQQQRQYHKASAILSPTALASVPQSISNHITNSSSVSTTKHQQSYHQQH